MSSAAVFLPRPDGTGAVVQADAIRALVGYLEQSAGVTHVLGCGCTNRVECGYHREQRGRAVLDIHGGQS